MRFLWILIFGGLVGGLYYYAHLPEESGTARASAFRWSMLWAPPASIPPSERLSLLVHEGVDGLRAPLDARAAIPAVEDLRTLADDFRAEALRAPRERRPIYEAAITTCQYLVSMVATRQNALAELENLRTAILPARGRGANDPAMLEHRVWQDWATAMAPLEKSVAAWYRELQRREQALGFVSSNPPRLPATPAPRS